ncbi:MAG: histidine phosphatase family protein [Lachnospiraceae bacterium]|nr:histidine phosphatase family protein [Lachnospiraceae bacterium]
MNIYLVRHGRQCSKLCNVDVELSKEGREQARLAGERLKKFSIDAVYSSNLIRAVETADLINESLNVERVIDPRFMEADFGDMTGMTNDELKEKYKDFLDQRARMIKDTPYPGGENCEMVFKRAFAALEDLVQKDYENVVVVTHGGVIRALFTGIVGADYAKWLTFGRQIENCSISHIMYDDVNKTYHLERLNDYAHIEDHDELLRKHFGSGFFVKKDK